MISIILPTYNRARLLARAIESVLAQTFRDYELIVVDDGSDDETPLVLKAFQERDKRIICLKNDRPSGGAAKPKNIGIVRSRGSYVAVIDSDDEWLPQKLGKQVALFEESSNPKLGVVGCDVFVVDTATAGMIKYRIPRYRNVMKNMLESDTMGTGSAMMYKREVFEHMGLFDENLKSGQDREMRIRLARAYDFDFVREPLVKYYVGEKDQISSRGLDLQEREADWDYLFQKYRGHYEADPRLLSNKLRYDGTRYILLGEIKKGRRALFASLKKNPFNLKSALYLILSLFGSRLYKKIARAKLTLANHT